MKMWAALGLWKVEPDSPLVIPALVSLLEDKEGNVNGPVCSSFAQFGDKAKPAVPAILRALRHEHWFTRRMATWTLMRLDPETAANVGMKRP